jgi:hypothetical protein
MGYKQNGAEPVQLFFQHLVPNKPVEDSVRKTHSGVISRHKELTLTMSDPHTMSAVSGRQDVPP